MQNLSEIFRKYGYGIFVTALVMLLGAISWRLRTSPNPIRQTAAAVPPPTAAPIPTASPIPTPAPTTEPLWLRPVTGGVLMPFGDSVPEWNASMDCWQTHAGIDLAAAPDEAVRAAADGRVCGISDDPLLGKTVLLEHSDGWQTLYASLGDVSVRLGDRLHAGDGLGLPGNSAESESLLGCHVHFVLLKDGIPMKPQFGN